MKTADISDVLVCRVYAEKMAGDDVLDALVAKTGAPPKVAFRSMERAQGRGLVDCGVSLRSGWLTEKGRALLEAS